MTSAPLVTTTLLLQRLKDSRDDDAWRTFDQRFRGVILATAIRLGLSESDAADAAQDTILQSLRDYQAGKYDRTKGRLSSWIVSIAHHRIVDILRARKGVRALDTSAGQELAPDADQVARAFDQALERKIFEQAWDELRSNSSMAANSLLAFELTVLRQVPPAEAALQCSMSVDQVYVAKNRVSQRLRQIAERFSEAFRDGL
jgi:RNA polymerase sigma-70 factor (ECF subfamily)